MNKIFVAVIAFIIAASLSCNTKSAPVENTSPKMPVEKVAADGKADWEKVWDKTLLEARKEAKVVIYTGVAPITRTEITKGFKRKFEGIDLEFEAGGGPELSQKIFSQRRAGLYLVDLYISGTTTMINTLKPAGVFEPFDSVLILPQVKDPQVWWQGKLPFVDKDHTIFSFIASPGGEGSIAINTEVMNPDEIKSYYEFLSPKFREKIIMMDPTMAGKGQRQMMVLATQSVLGWDYFKELVKQKPILTRNLRLQLEWIVQKKYLVALSPDEGIALEFKDAGAPVRVFGNLKEDVPWVTGSFGQISLMNRAAHPGALKIFVNWLLDREGQEIWGRTQIAQSARVDSDYGYMIQARKPVRQAGIAYYMAEDEVILLQAPELQKSIREIFEPLLR